MRRERGPDRRKSEREATFTDRFVHRDWFAKFRCAFRGAAIGILHTESFRVHLPTALLACGVALWLEIEAWRWAIVLSSVAAVMAVELLNSSIETLSRAVTRETNPFVRDALDIGAGAVLIASIGAMLLGLLAIGPPLWDRLFG
ncbi:MAG TPA: diacylglycerol kinase [Pirellulaceae bacterium]|nr:diacylglycerol kinase [Pirellulaceae bacterium]